MIDRRTLLQSLALAGAAGCVPALRAQGQVMKIFVGFPAGGLPDMVARALVDPLSKATGWSAVVENRPGANGRLAAQAVKNAPPDGRSLLITPASGMVHLPHVYKDLGYDPFADFVPVAQLVDNDFAFAISPKIPARNLKEFAEWANKNPAQATFGSPGLGSAPHFMGVTLARALQTRLAHVPYRGNNFALTDMSGGHIGSLIASTSFLAQAHKAGSVRILGTTGRARLASLPDVPTFQEQGIGQLTISEGTWLMAHAKTPAALVDKLADGALASLATPEMAPVIQGQASAAPLKGAALAKVMREDYDRRGAAIRAANFSASE